MFAGMIDEVLRTGRQEWQTPGWLLEVIKDFAPIRLDPATNFDNPCGAKRIATVHTDGLKISWDGDGLVYVNPPMGKGYSKWVKKALWSDSEVILLAPAYTGAQWFHDAGFDSVCFLRDRLIFRRAGAQADFYSMLMYWGDNKPRFRKVFGGYGLVL